MATARVGEQNLTHEGNLCSICLEQYKLPVTLPCSHSLCQTCLTGHIKFSCVNLDSPLGFPCPLCRVFISAPGRIGQYSLDLWATKFPENKLLASVIGKESLNCKPCQRDEEEVKANSWCHDCCEALCKTCEKCHKKLRPTSHHCVVSLTDWSVSNKKPFSIEICEDHDGRKLELFCKKHFQPCCSVCVTQGHTNCNNFCQLEGVDEDLVGPAMEEHFQKEVEKFCSTIEKTIQEEKENIETIDDTSDKFTKDLSELTAAIIQQVKRVEEKHLDQLAKLSKEAKSKLQQSVESLEQRLQYLLYWKEALLEKGEKNSQEKRVLSYIKMKNVFTDLQDLNYSKLKICIQTKFFENAQQLKDVACLAETTLIDQSNRMNLNLTAELHVATAEVNIISTSKFTVENISGGEILKNGQMILAYYDGKKIISFDPNHPECVILREISLSGKPWDVCVSGEDEVLVTLPYEKKVLRLDSDSLVIKEIVSVTCFWFGIAVSGNTTVIGTRASVLSPSGLDNTRYTRLSHDLSQTFDVALDDNGNIVFSSRSQHTVRKIDKVGIVLFSYTHRELKRPLGLTIDRNGEIFVGGYDSNNIHILSQNGELLRILKGVVKPTWLKFHDDTNRLFVKETGRDLKVFQFTAPQD